MGFRIPVRSGFGVFCTAYGRIAHWHASPGFPGTAPANGSLSGHQDADGQASGDLLLCADAGAEQTSIRNHDGLLTRSRVAEIFFGNSGRSMAVGAPHPLTLVATPLAGAGARSRREASKGQTPLRPSQGPIGWRTTPAGVPWCDLRGGPAPLTWDGGVVDDMASPDMPPRPLAGLSAGHAGRRARPRLATRGWGVCRRPSRRQTPTKCHQTGTDQRGAMDGFGNH